MKAATISTISIPSFAMDTAPVPELSTTPSTSSAAYPISTFNRHKQLAEIHCLLADCYQYQVHTRFNAASYLPPIITQADGNARQQIVQQLRDKHCHLKTLKRLINMIDKGNEDLIYYYDHPELEGGTMWNANTWT